MRRTGLWLAAAFLLSVAPADARVRQAETILPPGQSGFVSTAGVASGTGSPHLYDQQPLFTAFRYKNALFRPSAAGGTERPRPGVTITRDDYGVPAIEGASETDAWYGAGYAVAQDRLFQIELFRRATTGRLAEILGREFLADDLIARRDYYTGEELERMFRALPASLQARAAAYRDGVNAWVRHVRETPEDLPGEYVALAVQPAEITEREQAAIGVFLARTVPSGDGEELRNLRTLRALGARSFDRLLPLRQARETVTIPARDAVFSNQPGRSRRTERRAYRRSIGASADWELPAPSAGAAAARSATRPGLPGRVGGSSMFAVKGRDGSAVLFNGPQLGFSAPELFVELEVHYPGVDLRGVSAAGIPVMGIGHNGELAWGFTSGLSDEDDLYAEALTERDGETYTYRGRRRAMDCREETFTFRSPPPTGQAALGELLEGGADGASGTRTERICRTLHGPVQARAGRTAYARRYAIWNRELETIVGLDGLNRARTVQEADAALRQVTWNENVMAADSRGQIGFWHPGLHQLRPHRFDERLPYPGTGEAEWRGLRDRARTPRVINPRQGWLSNWNNLPAKGWTSGDAPAAERVGGRYHRGEYLARAVRGLHAAGGGYEAAKGLIRGVGATAQQRPLAGTRLRNAARRARGESGAVLGALLAWSGDYHATDAAGTVDPGVAIWEQFKDALEAQALRRLGARGTEADDLSGDPSDSHEFDASNGEAYALRTTSGAGIRQAARETFETLSRKFGTREIGRWRERRRLYDVQAQGAGSPPELPFFDRGTWEQFVEVGP